MEQLSFRNLDELQPLAKDVLPEGVSQPTAHDLSGDLHAMSHWWHAEGFIVPQVFCYIAGGAEDEATLRDNRRAYSRYRLMPRVMVDVSRIDTSCVLLGEHQGLS